MAKESHLTLVCYSKNRAVIKPLVRQDGGLHDDKAGESLIEVAAPLHVTWGSKRFTLYLASFATGSTFGPNEVDMGVIKAMAAEKLGPENATGSTFEPPTESAVVRFKNLFKGMPLAVNAESMHTLMRWAFLGELKRDRNDTNNKDLILKLLAGGGIALALVMILLTIVGARGGHL